MLGLGQQCWNYDISESKNKSHTKIMLLNTNFCWSRLTYSCYMSQRQREIEEVTWQLELKRHKYGALPGWEHRAWKTTRVAASSSLSLHSSWLLLLAFMHKLSKIRFCHFVTELHVFTKSNFPLLLYKPRWKTCQKIRTSATTSF